MKKTLLSLFALAAMSTTALAADVKPALVYGTGGKFDKSFNEAAYGGAEKFKAETGIDYRDFEPTSDTQGEQAIRNFASRGFNPVVAVSFAWTSAVEKVAAEFPDTQFVIVDSVVDKPNVRSVVYKEEEGSYLVGLLAGMASTTGKVGFVGGMDIPLIRKFACGYEQGARAAKADIEVFQNMTGTTALPGTTPFAAANSPRTRSTRARTLSTRRQVPLASAFCRPLPTTASFRSASIPTRTTCIPARS